MSQNDVRVVCEFCANLSEKPAQTSREEFMNRLKRSNKSRRDQRLTKTLDHGIGVRIPASQPFDSRVSSARSWRATDMENGPERSRRANATPGYCASRASRSPRMVPNPCVPARSQAARQPVVRKAVAAIFECLLRARCSRTLASGVLNFGG